MMECCICCFPYGINRGRLDHPLDYRKNTLNGTHYDIICLKHNFKFLELFMDFDSYAVKRHELCELVEECFQRNWREHVQQLLQCNFESLKLFCPLYSSIYINDITFSFSYVKIICYSEGTAILLEGKTWRSIKNADTGTNDVKRLDDNQLFMNIRRTCFICSRSLQFHV